MVSLKGTGVFQDIVVGRLVFYEREPFQIQKEAVQDAGEEMLRYLRAKEQALLQVQALHELAKREVSSENAAIFQAHHMMLEDQDFNNYVLDIIRNQQANAEYAVQQTARSFYEVFSALPDPYLQQRAADILDVSHRLISILTYGKVEHFEPSEPSILASEELVPSEVIQIPREKVLAFVTRSGSETSHAAIITELLKAGLPVFTELNLVDDGYDRNLALAREKGVPLFLSSTMLYRRETQYIKAQVAAFGRPVHYIYHIGQYLPDWHPWENYKNFFVGNARTGGVREILGIDLPWLLDAFGPADPAGVTVRTDTISALGLPYPDCATLLLRHRGGAQGVLVADVVSPKAVRSFECYGEGLHLFWEGNPKALYEFKDGEKRPVDTYASFEHDSRYSDNIVENAYVDELANFFAVLKGEETPRWSFEQDRAAIAIMDRVQAQG